MVAVIFEVWPAQGAQEKSAQVPGVLMSGHHENIRRWRLKQALGRTWLRRRDLLAGKKLGKEEQELLEEFRQEHEKDGARP